jgi:hypothetical protein
MELRETELKKPHADRLNHGPLRDLLCREIALRLEDDRDGEMLALFGPWGSGKTSTLNLVRYELERNGQPIAFLHFDAWAYQGAGGLVPALLTQLARLRKERPAVETLKKVFLASALGTADMLLSLFKLNEVAKSASAGLKQAESILETASDARTVLRDALKEEVEAVAKKLKAELVVVMVDNIDRCAPDSALGLLESLFVAGRIEKLMVIAVADQQVLMDFITKKYGIPSFDGARYLEKMFPDYFRVPDPWVYWHETRAETLAQAAKANDTIASLLVRLLKEAAHPTLTENEDLLWFAFSQVAALRNPRRIKRIVRRLERLKKDRVGADFEAVFLLVVLCDLWPHVAHFRTTVSPEGWRDFLLGVAKGEPPKTAPAMDFEFRDFVVQLTNSQSASDYHDSVLLDHEQLEYAADAVRPLGL